MDLKTLENITDSCKKLLTERSVGSAIEQLIVISRYCSDSQIISQAEELKENYRSMLTFLANGGKDENRAQTKQDINRKALEILRTAHRNIRIQEPHTHYSKAFSELSSKYGNDAEAELLCKWSTTLPTEEQMETQDHLFNLIWTSPLWKQKQTAQWYEFLSRQTDVVKIHLVGAVFLSLWEYLDEEKISFLFLFTDDQNEKLRAFSITALLFLAEKYIREIQFYPNILRQYRDSHVGRYSTEVYKEKLHIHQTIIILKEIEEENNNWIFHVTSAEKIEKHVQKNLKRVRYMIEKGLDFNLSERVTMWGKCEFLRNSTSHWFLPFEKTSPLFSDLIVDKNGNLDKRLLHLFDLVSDCDVDRYAMFSFMASAKNKSNLVQQILENLPVSENEMAQPFVNHFRIVMQNLFRFFDYSLMKNELENPFVWPYMFWENHLIAEPIAEDEAVALCKQMVEIQYYSVPIEFLQKVSQTSGSSLPMMQIMGQCYFHLKEYNKAIETLNQLLLLDEENEWALSLMQQSYKQLGRSDQQLEYLKKLLQIKPDKISYLEETASTLMSTRSYEEALKYLFHLNFLEPDTPQYMQHIVDCAIPLRKFDVAERYIQTLLALPDSKDKDLDYLRAGHICFLLGDNKTALKYYRNFYNLYNLRPEKQRDEKDADQKFEHEANILMRMGIKESDTQLMLDMIKM